jgi:omega-6 fatty acid desaturase (delta-12 desaturase)
MPFNPIVIVTRGEKPAWYQDTAFYARASLRRAIWQLSTTLAAYFLLFALMVYTVQQDYPYRESLETVHFKLWDEDNQRLVGFR